MTTADRHSTQNGPRDMAAVLASRYVLTAKGEAAVAAMRAEDDDG